MNPSEQIDEEAAMEQAQHQALVWCGLYVDSKGLGAFLQLLEEYSVLPTLPFVKNYAFRMENNNE